MSLLSDRAWPPKYDSGRGPLVADFLERYFPLKSTFER